MDRLAESDSTGSSNNKRLVIVHVVAARLGHADPSVTLGVYAHVIPQQAAEVADRFARLLEDGDDAPESSPKDGHDDDSAEGR